MSFTKRQFVTSAFEEIGLAAWAFDLQPDQLQSALVRLEIMVSSWGGRNIYIGYPLAGNPKDANLDDDTDVPDSAIEAIVTNLALKIAPSYGKVVSQETKINAKETYNVLVAKTVKDVKMQYPATLPRGAGGRINNNRTKFFPIPTANTTNPDSPLFLNLG